MKKPKLSTGDTVHAIVRSALGAIPVAGQASIELFNRVITPPIEKRRDEWILSIAQRIEDTQRQVPTFSVESLTDRPDFITALLQATQAALRTHHKEKLEALQNAVLNVALQEYPDELVAHMFVTFIDDMQPLHMRVLAQFDKSSENPMVPEPAGFFVSQYFPELSDRMEVYEQIVRDLDRMGLVQTNVTPGTATAFFAFVGKVSELGRELLKFISAYQPTDKSTCPC